MRVGLAISVMGAGVLATAACGPQPKARYDSSDQVALHAFEAHGERDSYVANDGRSCIHHVLLDETSLYVLVGQGTLVRLDKLRGSKPTTLVRDALLTPDAALMALTHRNIYTVRQGGVERIPKAGGSSHSVARELYELAADGEGAVWIEPREDSGRGGAIVALDDSAQQPRVLWQDTTGRATLRDLQVRYGFVGFIAEAQGQEPLSIQRLPRSGGAPQVLYRSRDGSFVDGLTRVGDLRVPYVLTPDGAAFVVSRYQGPSLLQVARAGGVDPQTLAESRDVSGLRLLGGDGDWLFWVSLEEKSLGRARLDGSGAETLPIQTFPLQHWSRPGEPVLVEAGPDLLALSASGTRRWPVPDLRRTRRIVVDDDYAYALTQWWHPHGECLDSAINRLPSPAVLKCASCAVSD